MHPKWGTSQKLTFNFDVYSQTFFFFFDYFVTAHAIITKIIGLVYLFRKIILISKKIIFHDFCGRLDQIRLQKMVRTACYPYTETMFYK